jgi:site-specific recombinase XerD
MTYTPEFAGEFQLRFNGFRPQEHAYMQTLDLCHPTPAVDLRPLIEKVKKYAQSAKSPATIRAYRREWNHFESWCVDHRLTPLPATPETVAMYIADCASDCAVSTITRRLTAITKAHQAAAYPNSPSLTKHFIVGETMKGIRRILGTAQHGKDPLLTADIREIVERCPNNLLGLRDRALVLVGIAVHSEDRRFRA